MRKNKTMRVASLLLVAVLMTTCVISGTYAKYVTAGEAIDTARVAKFGVEVRATAELFSASYDKHDSSYDETALTVVASDAAHVVAPGTAGNITAATLTGKPEVAVRVAYTDVDFKLGSNWAVDGDYYCPLIITVNDDKLCGLDFENAAAFETAVNEAISGVTADFAPNTDLGTGATDANVNVSWSWPFETTDTEGTNPTVDYDELDTALGDAAATAATFDAAATVSLSYKVTVTQID